MHNKDLKIDDDLVYEEGEVIWSIGCSKSNWEENKENCLERANYEFEQEANFLMEQCEKEFNL